MSVETLSNIKSAYKKFKSYIYYDNTSLHTRINLAKFESSKDFEKKLEELDNNLNNFIENKESLKKYISDISYVLVPKKIKNNSKEDNSTYTNKTSYNNYEVEDFNIFIDCPIEIHIISVLWIMKVGHSLDKELLNNVKGDRLQRNKDGNFENNRIRLFKKYHEQYIEFRDNAIKKAIALHKENLDITLINLDVKSFYYNIKFNFLDSQLEDNKLNKIMNLIHLKYQDILENDKVTKIKNIKKDRILPIGLLSSKIIANYTLKEFDSKICNDLKPAIYSRYVDDMLFVIVSSKENIMEDLSNKLEFSKENEEYKFKVRDNNFIFQNKKVKTFTFFKNESIYLLDKFSKTITNNASVFNLLPNDEKIFNTIGEESYNIHYKSTINKVSSITGNTLDKLKISINISQMTKIILNTNYDKNKIKEYNSHIVNLFSGYNILELRNNWERLFTYLYISKSNNEFIKMFRQIIETVLNSTLKTDILSKADLQKLEKKLKIDLINYLINSITLSISLSKENFNKSLKNYLDNIYEKNNISKFIDYMINNDINDNFHKIRTTNLLRHYFIQVPLINYCKKIDNISFINKSNNFNDFDFEIDEEKLEYSPRFIHYHEIINFYHLKFLHNKEKDPDYLNKFEDFISEKYHKFNKFNKTHSFPDKDINNKKLYIHRVPGKNKKGKLKVGIVNIKINENNSLDSFKTNPNLSFKRLFEIHKILNMGKDANCDIIIFPEISIPYKYINLIADFSKKNNIAFIFGVEHFSINKVVFNYTAIILPFKDGKYQNIYINYLLKKHYSPEEKEVIMGSYYRVASDNFKSNKINIYNWQGIFFSVFNCFELTNIVTRSKLIGKNDFTVVIEHNKDVNYFSNIVESMSRDNHVYMVQVNNSMYGDSRITQPSKTEMKDIIKIKGGENTLLVVGEIDIKKLREFQSKKNNLQKKDKVFKQTPPNFYNEMFEERKV